MRLIHTIRNLRVVAYQVLAGGMASLHDKTAKMKIFNASVLSIGLFLSFAPLCCAADAQVNFSPNGGATSAIVKELGEAKKEILVQAYSFTSSPIAKALVDANTRGVKVTAILDKSNKTGKYSVATYLNNAGIPVYIDYLPAIAHSKIIIIDQSIIITGSFNFTKAAEEKNTENLLVLKNDPKLVEKYIQNFNDRLKVSESMEK